MSKKKLLSMMLLILIIGISIEAKQKRFFLYSPTPSAQVPNIPDDLVKRVNKLGYTHFIYGLKKDATANDYKTVFTKLDIATGGELKYVPSISLASKWSGSYGLNNLSVNIYTYTKSDGTIGTRKCPSFAKDSNLENVINGILSVIRDGYVNSGASTNGDLEYLFWGHDEPFEDINPADNIPGELLCANGNVSIAQKDLEFISDRIGEGDSPNVAFRKLFVNEVEQRLDNLEAYLLFDETKSIIFADMWDPETHGGIPSSVSFLEAAGVVPNNTRITLAPNDPNDHNEIVDLPGCANVSRFREKVILATWCYQENWLNNPNPRVYPQKTFEYFASNNLKFMFTSASNFFANDQIKRTNIHMIHEYVYATKKYKDSLLEGYIGAIWTDHSASVTGDWDSSKGIYNQSRNFDIIEMLHKIYHNTSFISK